jgi:hypothetical protein
MIRQHKCSVDFLPSGDVHLTLDANVSTTVGLKVFELLAVDEAKVPARKKTAKRVSKTPS